MMTQLETDLAPGRIMQLEQGRTLLHIPRTIARDSAWPFAKGERVLVTLDPKGKRLLVEKFVEAKPSLSAVLACLLLVLASLAGCAGRPSEANSTGIPETRSRILVDDGAGGQTAVNVTNGTGTVYGQVLTDAGFGLPGARVTVLGADHGATTNESGWFEVTQVQPGKRLVRAEHPNYRAAESEVDVKTGEATRLVVTLVPPVEGDAGERPHTHDYWAGRTDVTIVDGDYPFYPSPCPTDPVCNGYNNAMRPPGWSSAILRCTSGTPSTTINPAGSPVIFSEPQQLVWEGTTAITVKVSWSAPAVPKLALAWKTGASININVTKGFASGESITIDVSPSMWDAAHQPFSFWRFWVCPFGSDETSATTTPRVLTGNFHVNMALHGRFPGIVDPPHPRFWQAGNQTVFLNETRHLDCQANDSMCADARYWPRTGEKAVFGFSLHNGLVVPPGTKEVVARLSWTFGTPGPWAPLSLQYSPADQPPSAKDSLKGFRADVATASGPAFREYKIPVKGSMADSFYQHITNWEFLWGHEGKENENTFAYDCMCPLSVSLTAIAVKDPDYG